MRLREIRAACTATVRVLPFLLAGIAYAYLRVLNAGTIKEPRSSFGDTTDYLLIGSHSLFSREFWLSDKPVLIPLFFKILGGDPERIFTVQLVISILCWIVLAIACAFVIRSYVLKLLAFAVVLGFSLTQQIILWDSVILTESLTFSLMALFYAAGLLLAARWSRWTAAVFILLAVLLAFARDANAYMLLMAAAVLFALALWFREARLRLAVLGAAFTAIFVVSSILASSGHHGSGALMNVLVGRIMPREEYRVFMQAQGMPLPAVAPGDNPYDWDALQDPRLADLRSWARLHGKSALFKFYWHFKADTLQAPLEDPVPVMAPDLYYYSATGFRPILERTRFGELLYPMRFGVIIFWLANLAAAFAAACALQQRKIQWLMPLLMILLAYPQIVFIWNSDPHDIWRHALALNVQWRFGLWLLVLLAADEMVVPGLLDFRKRMTSPQIPRGDDMKMEEGREGT